MSGLTQSSAGQPPVEYQLSGTRHASQEYVDKATVDEYDGASQRGLGHAHPHISDVTDCYLPHSHKCHQQVLRLSQPSDSICVRVRVRVRVRVCVRVRACACVCVCMHRLVSVRSVALKMRH